MSKVSSKNNITFSKDISNLNGKITHLKKGYKNFKYSTSWQALVEDDTISCRVTPVPCSHQDPGSEKSLACLFSSSIDAPVQVEEQLSEQHYDELLLNKLYKSDTLNVIQNTDDPQVKDTSDSDFDLLNNDTFTWETKILGKSIHVEKENILEICILDQSESGNCYLRMDTLCSCTKENILCEECSPCNCTKNPDLKNILKNKLKDKPKASLSGKFIYLINPPCGTCL